LTTTGKPLKMSAVFGIPTFCDYICNFLIISYLVRRRQVASLYIPPLVDSEACWGSRIFDIRTGMPVHWIESCLSDRKDWSGFDGICLQRAFSNNNKA